MSDTYDKHRGFTLSRHVDAPREIVFRYWTDPASLAWFFNPTQPIPTEPIEVNPTVGGAWRQRMVVDRATNYVTGGIYRQIHAVDRLMFYWGAVGGWPEIDPAHPDDNPLCTVILDDLEGQTEMVFSLALPDAWDDARVRAWEANGPRDGWSQTLGRLVDAAALAAQRAEERAAL